jgi:integrase
MAHTPQDKYDGTRKTLWEGHDGKHRTSERKVGNTVTEADAERIQELCDAFDEEKLDRSHHTEKKANFSRKRRKDRSYTTLQSWMYRLVRIAEDIGSVTPAETLRDTMADDINELAEDGYYEGNAPSTDGMSKGTVQSYQNAARMFYRYHDDLGVNPEQIARYSKDEPSVDPKDMLIRDEIEALASAADGPRDKMIFHLLLYTGLRSTAARQLRIKDIDLDDGSYRLPSDLDGLKNADKRDGKRPLLLAEGSIRRWLRYHPCPDDPDAYLITAKPNSNGNGYLDPYDPVSHGVLSHALTKMKERTDVEKPVYPHVLRHNFVTICKRDYELPDDTVKYLIGHAKDSRVMETTYSHLSGDKHTDRAEVAAGLKEPDEETSTLTPKVCECGTQNPPDSKACHNCGIMFTPDAKQAQKQVHQDIGAAKALSEDDVSDEELEAIANNDALLAKLIELRSDN